MPPKTLLAIDGGGLRGIIPVCALVELEARTGKLTRETVSFVAGTSTGALTAAAIAGGIPASSLLSFYLNRLSDVFTRSGLLSVLRHLFGRTYSTSKVNSLVSVMAEEFGVFRQLDVE